MARVVVVGGGFGGVAAAVRLAKLRHDVTLLEQEDTIGGRLRRREHGEFAWARHSETFTLPAVLRDLFRKSGRPLERELDLVHLSPGRRHVFADFTRLDLPLGTRGEQTTAIDEALDGGGQAWAAWVDSLSPAWEVLRQQALERPFGGRSDLDRRQLRVLRPRRVVRTEAKRAFKDHRLRAILLDDVRAQGQPTRSTPAFAMVKHHVERGFGRWRVDGGMPALLSTLAARLEQRRVDIRCGVRALDVGVDGRTVVGVTTEADPVTADVVVWAAPTPPPSIPAYGGLPLIPQAITHLGLTLDVPELPSDTVLHGNPVVTIHTGGAAPLGYRTWTVEHSGAGGEDVLDTMRRRGVNVADFVVDRVDVSPTDQLIESGPAYGWQWQGWRSALDRPGVGRSPLGGLFLVGAGAHPGPSLELVGLGAAAAAASVGRA
ncbi:phytoene desaturase family protein [Solicola gregarius]|uniref:FAD-dependent oxidoreductase n=1 Tax=Solicola gregarius TaxID=2908642 RepID=A0AA46YK59_9ACTN|nr:FAD-dependent oxidoreductase [Solicola gregarius]UYM05370.1 FAD-dependent oxidoreductase [Solicola gregarius]